MADPRIVTTLRTEQAERHDVIGSLEGELAEARSDLGHVDVVLRFHEVDGTHIRFLAHVNPSRLLKRGDLLRMSREALQGRNEPITARELAESIIAAKGLDMADEVLRAFVAHRPVQALTVAWRRKAPRSPGKAGNVRLWALLPQDHPIN